MALTHFGYLKTEAEEAIGHVTDEGLDAETYIKKALKYSLQKDWEMLDNITSTTH